MNCANHPQNPVAAYCRTCGKPLCTSRTRQVMGVVYCENCLAERVAAGAPSADLSIHGRGTGHPGIGAESRSCRTIGSYSLRRRSRLQRPIR